MDQPLMDLTGAKILAVDDVPANLDVLSQALESDGYNVLVATNGETALNLVDRIAPDLILLDVMMPGIDGFETCRRLKANVSAKGIPVIFLTARNELEGVLEGFQAGGVDYISKPFKKEEVLIRIRTHLERARLAKALADLNAHLEQKVAERTSELEQKVRELEGKDQIAQHLLTYHTLDETLAHVLGVIDDVTGLGRVLIHLYEDGTLTPASGISGASIPEHSVAAPGDDPARDKAFERVIDDKAPVRVDSTGDSPTYPFVLVPILRGDVLLGVIEAGCPLDKRPLTDGELRTLGSFALQIAVAISDAQVQRDASQWKEQLDQLLDLDVASTDLSSLNQLFEEQKPQDG